MSLATDLQWSAEKFTIAPLSLRVVTRAVKVRVVIASDAGVSSRPVRSGAAASGAVFHSAAHRCRTERPLTDRPNVYDVTDDAVQDAGRHRVAVMEHR